MTLDPETQAKAEAELVAERELAVGHHERHASPLWTSSIWAFAP